jgi:hypothetical protein
METLGGLGQLNTVRQGLAGIQATERWIERFRDLRFKRKFGR